MIRQNNTQLEKLPTFLFVCSFFGYLRYLGFLDVKTVNYDNPNQLAMISTVKIDFNNKKLMLLVFSFVKSFRNRYIPFKKLKSQVTERIFNAVNNMGEWSKIYIYSGEFHHVHRLMKAHST